MLQHKYRLSISDSIGGYTPEPLCNCGLRMIKKQPSLNHNSEISGSKNLCKKSVK